MNKVSTLLSKIIGGQSVNYYKIEGYNGLLTFSASPIEVYK